MDRVVHSVPCLVVEFQAMLFAGMLFDQHHDFQFDVAAHLPITVLRHHI